MEKKDIHFQKKMKNCKNFQVKAIKKKKKSETNKGR